MNNRNGLKRLTVALSLPYFGFWAYYGYTNWKLAADAGKFHDSAFKRGFFTLADALSVSQRHARAEVERALVWGVGAPLVLLLACSVAYWVYRGFVPKAAP